MPDIDIALKQIKANLSQYQLYDNYYDGAHFLAFASDKFNNAFGSLFHAFADNLCPAVVDALADRLIITGFTVEEGETTAGEAAWNIWQENRMDQRAGEAHESALKLGDAYVIVWPNKDNIPRLHVNDARQMTVFYNEDEPGEILWAAKAWATDDGYKRLTLYYPDRLEKYITRASSSDRGLPQTARSFVPYEVPGEAWPLPNPYERVPVFHLANNAGIGKFGKSELKHIIPLQDALNKSVMDMLVAMEFVAFPQRYATGIQIPLDADGKPMKPFNPSVDRLWVTTQENAHFGEFTAADLTNFLSVSDSIRLEIARVSGRPLHYMQLSQGNPPSGESLKTLEARFVKQVKDRHSSFGNTWEDIAAFALRIAGITNAHLSAEWMDAAPVSETEKYAMADIAKNKLGFDDEYVWGTLLDIPDAEIKKMLRRKAKRQAEMAASMASAAPTQPGVPQNGPQAQPGQSNPVAAGVAAGMQNGRMPQ